jgi:hypothetical protein
MSNDYLKKEPSKTEKMIYELFMQHQSMEKAIWSTSTLNIVLAILTKTDPEKIAELMVNGNDEIKEYSKKVNEAVDKLEKIKHPEAEHNHDHSHEGHDHGHEETAPVDEKTQE